MMLRGMVGVHGNRRVAGNKDKEHTWLMNIQTSMNTNNMGIRSPWKLN